MSAPLLSVSGLERRFAAARAVSGLTLSFSAGERVLLVGENGSGKSTLLRMLAGLLRPTRGSITYHGDQPAIPPEDLGYLGHALQLFGPLTVRENLELFAGLQGVISEVEPALISWELSKVQHKRVESLSRGLQVRLGLARTFIHRPRVILLDEPTANLDQRTTDIFFAALGEAKDRTGNPALVLVASHELDRFAPSVTRVVALSHGEILLDSGGPLRDAADTESIHQELHGFLARYRAHAQRPTSAVAGETVWDNERRAPNSPRG